MVIVLLEELFNIEGIFSLKNHKPKTIDHKPHIFSKLLGRVLYSTALVVLFGLPFRYRQAFPGRPFDHPADINELSGMVRLMGQLPVDGINDRQGFLPDRNGFQEVIFLQGFKRIDKAFPSFVYGL